MPQVVMGEELLRMAVEIEKQGRKFYSTAAGNARSGEVRDQFRLLADQEKRHEATFNEMLDRIGRFKPEARIPEPSEGERKFLKSIAESSIFIGSKADTALNEKGLTDVAAIEIGIGFEKDSILFYSEIRGMFPRDEQSLIDVITSEEKKHLSDLNYIKVKLLKA